MYPQVFGKYVLERELARGGMARVLLATLRGAGGFEKKLVVKQIRDELASDDEFVRRFVEEAKTTVALAHPNIVPVYELGVEFGTYLLVMEYVAGASLAEILRSCDGKGLSPEEGAYVGVEVCRALDYAHRRMNVVHRDVTPRNVMVDEEGQVKVIDFGISAPVATAPSGQGVFGSPGHMPPEQMAGTELTPAADVFAVAALLMELWSGKPPFRRRTLEAIMEALGAPHLKPGEIDPRLTPLDSIFTSALALDPRSRPQQADDLSRALRRFLSDVDLGDVARTLGDRVRSVRNHPPPPASEVGPVLQRPPSRPTGMLVGTKTFAARGDGVVFGAAAPAAQADPANPVGSSTRRLPSTAPPALAAKSLRPAAVVRRLAWPGLMGVAGIAVAAFFLGRGAATSTATTPPPRPPDAPVPLSGWPPAQGATQGPTAAPPVIPVPPPAASAPSAPTPAAELPERGQLVLVGDGTRVSIDGVARGAAPARVAVDPGVHAVTFTFPATGESRTTSLTLRPGERATLRADFTGVRPTVRIER